MRRFGIKRQSNFLVWYKWLPNVVWHYCTSYKPQDVVISSCSTAHNRRIPMMNCSHRSHHSHQMKNTTRNWACNRSLRSDGGVPWCNCRILTMNTMSCNCRILTRCNCRIPKRYNYHRKKYSCRILTMNRNLYRKNVQRPVTRWASRGRKLPKANLELKKKNCILVDISSISIDQKQVIFNIFYRKTLQ